MNRPAELGNYNDDGVVPILAEEASGERGKPVTQGLQTIGELTLTFALIDVGVPAAQVGKGQPDIPVPTDQMGEPRRLHRKAVCWRRAVVGFSHFACDITKQLGARRL